MEKVENGLKTAMRNKKKRPMQSLGPRSKQVVGEKQSLLEKAIIE